ncbi:MAG TPA: MerR family transcriptional regulator [Ktedonobacteraceae bacterium]|nr:MerR family transcriptional regulator [Ktedonobacteraceae bacterium]
MNQPDVEHIKQYLQEGEVQKRVQERILYARSRAAVTISRAAQLFGFTENQLREWEKRGLIQSNRPALSQDGKQGRQPKADGTAPSQDGKAPASHRQYSPEELDKLALIRELLEHGYGLNEIPKNIDEIWKQVLGKQQSEIEALEAQEGRQIQEIRHVPLERRIESLDQKEFWRYFTAQVLRLSLLLICENNPDTLAGFVIPLERKQVPTLVHTPQDLPKLGSVLFGWLGRNDTFYTFIDPAPTFEYPSDFRIEYLRPFGAERPPEDTVQDNVLIIIQRKAKPVMLSAELVQVIARFVKLLYNNKEHWYSAFDYEMHDWLYQVADFNRNVNYPDETFNSLANIVVELGGKTGDGTSRWWFCNLFLPRDTSLPLQQRNLVVRAHSKAAPIHIDTYVLSSRNPGLTFRAYQSGHVIYRPRITPQDPVLAYWEFEQSTRSAIAIPIAGREGLAAACLYVSSEYEDAFSVEDQRVLRVITRMMEELLATYQARSQVTGKFSDLITDPGLVDTSFKEFLPEDAFINDVEAILADIHGRDMGELNDTDVLSFVDIDIDNLSSLATKYGDRITRNLSRAVGSRIQGQLRLESKKEQIKRYHVNADSYYLLLKEMTLEDARYLAERLRRLGGDYRIDARGVSAYRQLPPEELLELPNVTIRLGVQSYPYVKLKEILQRYPVDTAITKTRVLIMENIEESLIRGQREGGNCIISWDPDIWTYRRWSPPDGV